ncbi:MAG TPA: response regulator transcription factor [Polyangiaceae bacterium]|nr:response regulator transcription factor [Polyangiaceae bacterium]
MQSNRASPPRVLIVEDEPAIAESLDYALRREGFATQTAGTYAKAEAARTWPTLIILDLMLPDGNGGDLLRLLRAESRATPVIVLSSRESEADRISALEGGADDYVTKPFSPREVVARVRAVLRRMTPSSAPSGPAEPEPLLQVDSDGRRATFSGKSLELTRVEFDLLARLSENPSHVYTRAEFIASVWGDGFAITDRTIDSHIKSLRRKLTDAGAPAGMIQTVRGVGYRMASPGDLAAHDEAGAPSEDSSE